MSVVVVAGLGYVGLPLAMGAVAAGHEVAGFRDSTERPVTVTEGTNRLVGRNPGRIVAAAREVLAAPPPSARRSAPWDGQAGRRIAATLVDGQVG